MGDRLEEHYQNLGGDYEKIWFYEDGTEYQQFLVEGLKVTARYHSARWTWKVMPQ
jgi:hypothetical protein